MNFQSGALPPEVQLRRLADQCTVQVLNEAAMTVGSGFFVAPGLIVTCAHVLERPGGSGRAPSGPISVRWDGQVLHGRAEAVPADAGSGDTWALPDLGVIELGQAPEDQPFVVLGTFRRLDTLPVYLGGFNDVFNKGTMELQGKNVTLDGPQNYGELWQIVGREVAPGMSGGPVLDYQIGLVNAIVKARRGTRGGWVIPADAIAEAFPRCWQRIQDASAQAVGWNRIRAELPDQNPNRLSKEQREAILESAERLMLGPEQIKELWQEITGTGTPVFEPADLETMEDLLKELAEVYHVGGELPPLLKLFKHMIYREQKWAQKWAARGLRREGRSLADDRALRVAYDRYQVPEKSGEPPVFVVRLDNRRVQRPEAQVLLEIWRYQNGDFAFRQIFEPTSYDLADMKVIETDVTKALANHMGDLPGAPRIEFVLPDHLLDQPVEKWQFGNNKVLPLGERFPVVTRFLHREKYQDDALRAKAKDFKLRFMPGLDSPAWGDHWVTCGDPRILNALYSMLTGEGSPSFVAMTTWNRRHPVPLAVQAAREAGIPVILWQHGSCSQAKSGADACLSGRNGFRNRVTTSMSGVSFARLPHEVLQIRRDASANEQDTGHPGRDIAILWDDPSRCPWTHTPDSEAPVS